MCPIHDWQDNNSTVLVLLILGLIIQTNCPKSEYIKEKKNNLDDFFLSYGDRAEIGVNKKRVSSCFLS